ncbi:hypothetical protein DPMN_128883 [Dreissena polymorpha]|uniref:Uncharacterized protein n=1 Tax=Dreissena polymorpha TaxID=45954 RepID=A0A9D4JW51_DREPO|nr:hypothetical protein DPMN_128883 [Dreissena polymorpha]
MIARKPGQFVASGGVRINFKSHLKFNPTSGPGRNRVEIETRSDVQRTGIARRSPDIGFIERVSAKRKKTSAADRTVLNFVTHRTADGSDVSSLPDAWRSDTSD